MTILSGSADLAEKTIARQSTVPGVWGKCSNVETPVEGGKNTKGCHWKREIQKRGREREWCKVERTNKRLYLARRGEAGKRSQKGGGWRRRRSGKIVKGDTQDQRFCR